MDMNFNKTGIKECNITRFGYSLNSIDTILNEIWKPRIDSYTEYLGE